MSNCYLFSVHAQIRSPPGYRDPSFCQFDEVLLNPTGNLECLKMKVLKCSYFYSGYMQGTAQATQGFQAFFMLEL